jgi:hypothetical protein
MAELLENSQLNPDVDAVIALIPLPSLSDLPGWIASTARHKRQASLGTKRVYSNSKYWI